jgi:lysozyme
MQRLSQTGEALIKSFEVLKLVAYLPTPRDRWTIGWGHTGHDVVQGLTWTLAQAEDGFQLDTAWACVQVSRTITVPLTQNQFDALVSFTFNVGATAEGHSTLCKLINQGYTGAASAEFLKWNKQAGMIMAGLTRRREAEQELFLTS